MTAAPRFLNAGEAALVIEFGATVDPQVNARVLQLDKALNAVALRGVLETVPTYRSLMVHYEPLVLGRSDLIAVVTKLLEEPPAATKAPRVWTVPCCYDPLFGEDIQHIAESTGLTAARVVELHSQAVYRVYMYGFAPGFTYLGGLPAELAISRRLSPRPPHPAQTVLVGGGLSLISTVAMPTGWFLVGRTPERMFSLKRAEPFLVQVGDEIRFEPIDLTTYASLDLRAEAGEIVAAQDIAP